MVDLVKKVDCEQIQITPQYHLSRRKHPSRQLILNVMKIRQQLGPHKMGSHRLKRCHVHLSTC